MRIKSLLLTFIAGLAFVPAVYAQETTGNEIKESFLFKFSPGNDGFYLKGNERELERLYDLVDTHKETIVNENVLLYVTSYSVSLPDNRDNLNHAKVMANRVKSELITNKGLSEDDFRTANRARSYGDVSSVVVVEIGIPFKKRDREPAPVVEPVEEVTVTVTEPEQEPIDIARPQPVAEPEPAVIVEQVYPKTVTPPHEGYCFALRTNLLYDAFLLPTLGVEWRVNRHVGIKLDGSFSHWGNPKGKVQKMWLVSPEVRWYMGTNKRFYAGLGFNIGEANIYGTMISNMFSKDVGYQGNLYGGGVTVGYMLRLNRALSLDFNVGLGYTRFEYDTFGIINEVRVYRGRGLEKNFWGPTQAGVTLVWRLGEGK